MNRNCILVTFGQVDDCLWLTSHLLNEYDDGDDDDDDDDEIYKAVFPKYLKIYLY